MGPKKLAVLTHDRINEVFFFYKKMYGRFARWPNKRGRNNEVTYYITEVAVRRGFTVIKDWKTTVIVCTETMQPFKKRRESPLDTAKPQAPVVQRLDSALHRINYYPADKYYGNQLRYPLDRDLSGG